ncbi:MAG TPA: von Willebrand factor type A domain-containing protein [Puia sp.]|jgi:Ca-activated chloride channel family protein
MLLKGILLLDILVLFFSTSLSAQYYFTGEVTDVHGDKLPNVSIVVQSTGALYKTGTGGSFEIMTRKTDDSLLFAAAGYEPYTTAIRSSDFLQIILKVQPPHLARKKHRILTASLGSQVSFPADINGLSYNMVHRFLDMGMTVPADAIRIEEMLNYFNFNYEEPAVDALFHCSSRLLPCPWEVSHRLLYVNVSTRITDREQAPPANLVYLIDASGSMDVPDKLPLIKTGFRSLITNLRDIDTVSLVIFGAKVRVVLQGVSGSHKGQILSAIEGLRPDGPSPGMRGVKLAYEVARQQRIEGGSNKVVLITDGDISDGAVARDDLKEMIAAESSKGIQLTCLGLGMDSTRNSELPWLAEAGKGNFASISDVREAEKVLLNELAGNICTVADSVCITAEFDTILVNEYHLIGFDNRVDSSDTTLRLEGGQIPSGHSLLALFELVPKKDSIAIENIAGIKIRYTLPGKKGGLLMDYNCPNKLVNFEKAAGDERKAACIALFGLKLKQSAYTSGIAWADIEKMTRKSFSVNNALDRDYITLVAKARKIYEHKK